MQIDCLVGGIERISKTDRLTDILHRHNQSFEIGIRERDTEELS